MSRPPDDLPIASDVLKRLSPEFRAVLKAVVRDYERRIAELDARLVSVECQNQTHSISAGMEESSNRGLLRIARVCKCGCGWIAETPPLGKTTSRVVRMFQIFAGRVS